MCKDVFSRAIYLRSLEWSTLSKWQSFESVASQCLINQESTFKSVVTLYVNRQMNVCARHFRSHVFNFILITVFKGYQIRASASRKRDMTILTKYLNSTHKKTSNPKYWHNFMNLFLLPNTCVYFLSQKILQAKKYKFAHNTRSNGSISPHIIWIISHHLCNLINCIIVTAIGCCHCYYCSYLWYNNYYWCLHLSFVFILFWLHYDLAICITNNQWLLLSIILLQYFFPRYCARDWNYSS